MNSIFWLRLFRDLKKRKIQVGILTIILGLGGGTWVGTQSMIGWREDSINTFFDEYKLDDGLIYFPELQGVSQQDLINLLDNFDKKSNLLDYKFRLRLRVTYNFSDYLENSELRGYLYGIPDADQNIGAVNSLALRSGLGLDPNESNKYQILVDDSFARKQSIGLNSQVNINFGNKMAEFVIKGTVTSPDWLIITDPEVQTFSISSTFVIGHTSINELQEWAGYGENVNEIVFTVKDGVDAEKLGTELRDYIISNSIYCEFTFREDTLGYQIAIDDIKSDAQMLKMIGVIVLIIVLFALWITLNRLVSHQRREIGIDQSLGVSNTSILKYYLGYSFVIIVMGLLFGLISGIIVGKYIGDVIQDLLNIPGWQTPIPWPLFVKSAGITVVSTLLAALLPAWQASRMNPISALRQDPSVVTSQKLIPIISWILYPISRLTVNSRMALRNISRNRRRTLTTILAFALIVTLIIFIKATFNTFDVMVENQDFDAGEWDLRVSLVEPLPLSIVDEYLIDKEIDEQSYSLTSLVVLQLDGSNSEILQLSSYTSIDFLPYSIVKGSFDSDRNGVAISQSYAEYLAIQIGDYINIQHVQFNGTSSDYQMITSSLKVTGFHNRTSKYDLLCGWNYTQSLVSDGSLTDSVTNLLYLKISDDVELKQIKGEILELPIVRNVDTRAEYTELTSSLFESMIQIIEIVEIICFLIAFSVISLTSLISRSEREREIGTMATLGASDWRILSPTLWEASYISIFGIFLGYISGWWLLKAVFLPIMSDSYESLVIAPELDNIVWVYVGILSWILALLSQFPIWFAVKKMDLSQATKVRDF
ncbi:MAG: FtsX-like permease family protein [Candidatus Heimdallarchaeota archaeon]|nr:FtsX-like permease family protein [Candidatus Heimdallarchaeota archaeon]